MRPFLQKAADTKEEHNRACGVKIPPDDGYGNCGGVQPLDLKTALEQTAKAPVYIAAGADGCVGGSQPAGEKYLCSGPYHNPLNQLFFVLPV